MADNAIIYVWESAFASPKEFGKCSPMTVTKLPTIFCCACCTPYFGLTGQEWRANLLVTRSCCGGFGLLQTLSSVLCISRRSVGKGAVEVVQIVELIPMAPSRERSPDNTAKAEVLQKSEPLVSDKWLRLTP